MAHQSSEPATLRLTRTFTAPLDRVFRAWTDPAQLKRWWGPPGNETTSAEIDLRAGGTYRFGMRRLPAGEVTYLTGTFQEVSPLERLVFTWRWESRPEEGESLVTIEFNDRGRNTEVVVTHERLSTIAARDKHDAGWRGSLDRLNEIL